MCDGVILEKGAAPYSVYRADFNTRKTISSPLQIGFTGSYNAGTGQGNVNAHITNTSTSSVSGTIRFVLTETDVVSSGSTYFNVVRDIIPDTNGQAVSIPASGSSDKWCDFTVSSSWNKDKCDIVVFVQGSSKEIYQAAKVHIMNMAVEEDYKITDYRLQIYPNPFSHTTVIRVQGSCSSPHDIPPQITIHDLSGRLIKTFNYLTIQPFNQIVWDGRDEAGEKVASGIYLCVLKCGDRRVVNKIALAR